MQNYDFSSFHDVHSIFISSNPKSGKITFLLYLIKFFYKEHALLFTSQESYLFNKRLDILARQFSQFQDIKKSLTTYHLVENWDDMKQKYGYTFLLQELETIIKQSNQQIIVFHRIGEFFGFQDRYEINNFYKALVKLAETHDKKVIFLANNKNENFEYIYQIAQEFSDMMIEIRANENNERVLDIKDIFHHKEYPLLKFTIHNDNFLLEYVNETKHVQEHKVKNILIAEIDKAHDNMRQICAYIFDKPNFEVKHADSLQDLLQEIFIRPDLIIVLMKRNHKNLETIRAIKMQLPTSSIVTILDQSFIRSEDIHELYTYGSDEVFANNFTFDKIILALQKTTHTLFYTQTLESLPHHANVLKNLDDFKALAQECISKSLFFTAFVLESDSAFKKLTKTSRKTDYVYQNEQDPYHLYYIALNTMPKDIFIIAEKFKKDNPDLRFTCIWEPINSSAIEECIK